MHQTLYLPSSQPIELKKQISLTAPPGGSSTEQSGGQTEPEKPIIRVVNHQEIGLVTKTSSKQEKTDYLRTIFFSHVTKNTDKMPAGFHEKVLIVWNRIEDGAFRNQVFDIDFLFEIYQEYIDYCFHIETNPHSAIVLSIFFQRVSGPMGSVEKSADYAYRDLKDTFNCSSIIVLNTANGCTPTKIVNCKKN